MAIDEDYISVESCPVVSNATVLGLSSSIRRAKFPMATDVNKLSTDVTKGILALATSSKGEGHDQFLTGIIVQFDLTFSNKAWVEAERYHWLDFVSSQSTMHRLARFDLTSMYNEYVDPRIIDIMKEKSATYNEFLIEHPDPDDCAEEKKRMYLELLYSNPAGFTLTAGMTTNYRQLKTIYAQRKNHRLPEWRTFCKWIETLPHSEFITGIAQKEDV